MKKSLLLLAGLLLVLSILALRSRSMSPGAAESHVSMYYYDNPDFFSSSLKPFLHVRPLIPPPHIFIVNQHILAASLIAHQFALASDPSVTTVVLITQNNWNAGKAPIITSLEGWKTPLGDLAADTELAQALIDKNLASPEEEVFLHEHGITGIVPYVAHAFPNARIIPLVIRDKTSGTVLDALAQQLNSLDLSHTAIIGTIDMSHYLPAYLADAHDRKTEQAIEHFDYSALSGLDIDTAPTLRVIMKVAEHFGETAFTTAGHTNSAYLTAQPDLLSTTSYLTGYFSTGPLSTTTEPVHILFTGDVMLDRSVALHAQRNGDESLVSPVERMFLGVDATVSNLEGTITTHQSVALSDTTRLQFTFEPHFAHFMKDTGISAVSLSNNHTYDFGASGYGATKMFLAQAGISSFGSPHNDDELSTKMILHGRTLCLVGYEAFVRPDATPILTEIKRIRSTCDLLVVTMHAGVEYSAGYTNEQQTVAHSFVDVGADVVVGTHPHVVEPLEIYKGKAVFYSLGNFIFDQNFSFATTHGLAVDIEWDGESARYTLVPIVIKGEQVSFPNTEDRITTLKALIDDNLPKSIASAILHLYSFTLN